LPVGRGQGFGIAFDQTGEFQPTPTNMHYQVPWKRDTSRMPNRGRRRGRRLEKFTHGGDGLLHGKVALSSGATQGEVDVSWRRSQTVSDRAQREAIRGAAWAVGIRCGEWGLRLRSTL